MKMVIGGAFQGKTDYASQKFNIAEEDWIDGHSCSKHEILHAKGVHHFHEFIRRSLQNGDELESFADELIRKNPDIIIVTNELGCGVVPLDAFERTYRERDGRICGELAAFSDEVDRVICGIGTVIKP